MPQKVVVVGQGYVGLPLAIRATEAGYDVVGFDTDETRVKLLESGTSFISDIPDTRLTATLSHGRYLPSADARDLEGFDYCVLAVPTPWAGTKPDLRCLEAAGRMVAPFVRHGCVVVLESTSYPGTTEDVLKPLLDKGSGLSTPEDYFLGFSPERIDPGNRVWSLENTPKVVSGVDATSLEQVRRFYDSLVRQTVPVSSPRTAELSKLLENTFRQVNIALLNELAQVSAKIGCDLWEAVDAASTKPFGYLRFTPGPGVGGHCLPIDSAYLSWYAAEKTGSPLRLVDLANEVNQSMPRYVVDRVASRLPLKGARVLLIGLAYKRNSEDIRESPSLEIAGLLLERDARVRVCDPLVPPSVIPTELDLVTLTEEEIRRADAVLILSDHDCFDYDLIQRHASYVFDARNRLPGATDRL